MEGRETNALIDVAAREEVAFGPFRLCPGERRLTRGGDTVALGARTLDILSALVARAGEPLSKRELMSEVWPDVTVGEASLRFHVANLRKALGDGRDGARYIATLSGRGYCFVAPISRSGERGVAPATSVNGFPTASVPGRLARMIGRADGILALSSLLHSTRFVTIVGTGGVGKTTVAVAVGHELLETFSNCVLFVDLCALQDPALIAPSVAAMLGLAVQSDNQSAALIPYLRDKRVLLILDNCEHLTDAAAALAEQLHASAPQIHILATSREALRVEGEHVYRLEPLAFPPDDLELAAVELLSFPAVQLFVERAAASGARLALSDADAAIVASICRRLDGVALAIELAAGRVGTYGLHQTAALLEERLSLFWLGQRTAPPRQQTLKATLDWSYALLSDIERRVLRQLAVFVGEFTLEGARAVLASASMAETVVLSAIDSLVAKSMIVIDAAFRPVRYRLLETTRAFALEASVDGAESAEWASRHADYYRRRLEETGLAAPASPSAAERALQLADLANVRAALAWCFGANGRPRIGVALAAAAAPVFFAKGFHTEGRRWADRAVAALDDSSRGGVEEMNLQAALGLALLFDDADSEAANTALTRSLLVAEARGDAAMQLQLLVPLYGFLMRTQAFNAALTHARRGVEVARTTADPAAIALARTILGMALGSVGDLNQARPELEAGAKFGKVDRGSTIHLASGFHLWAAGALARALWLQGRPAEAVRVADQAMDEAASTNTSLSVVVSAITPIFLWMGDWESAERHFSRWLVRGQSNPVALARVRAFNGQLAISRGDAQAGLKDLRGWRDDLKDPRHELETSVNISLAQGLAALGLADEALSLIRATIRSVEANGDLCHMPELLRMKGGLLLSMSQPDVAQGETCLVEAIELSRRQGARAWELRAATDLARLRVVQDRHSEARSLLQPVFDQFDDGFSTPDLRAAEQLLATLV